MKSSDDVLPDCGINGVDMMSHKPWDRSGEDSLGCLLLGPFREIRCSR